MWKIVNLVRNEVLIIVDSLSEAQAYRDEFLKEYSHYALVDVALMKVDSK